jgi:hypothetical protein
VGCCEIYFDDDDAPPPCLINLLPVFGGGGGTRSRFTVVSGGDSAEWVWRMFVAIYYQTALSPHQLKNGHMFILTYLLGIVHTSTF